MCLPTASAAGYPNSRSAPAFVAGRRLIDNSSSRAMRELVGRWLERDPVEEQGDRCNLAVLDAQPLDDGHGACRSVRDEIVDHADLVAINEHLPDIAAAPHRAQPSQHGKVRA